MTKNKILATTIMGVLAVTATSAFAGAQYIFPVEIFDNADGSGEADGAIGTARHEDNETSEIGCYIYKYGTSTTVRATCYASDAAGNYRVCDTTNSALIDIIRFVGDGTWIIFDWDASGKCTSADMENASGYEPKAP